MDVDQPRLPERHEVAVAGGELLAAGVVGAVAELVVGAPVLLRPGHVAARDDGAEDRDARGHRQQPRPAALRRATPSAAAPEVEQPAEQQHRQAEVGGHEALLEVLLDGRAAQPGLGQDQHQQRDRDRAGTAGGGATTARPARGSSGSPSPASARWVYSMIELRSTPGTTSPLQNGQPWKPEPPGPQPSPESDTRTMPPTMIRTNVAMAVARTSRRKPVDGAAFTSGRGYRLRGAAGCATVSAGLLRASTSRRMSFIGSTLRTRGIVSKLFAGGGDVVNHSSVLPCQGSLPARLPLLDRDDHVDERHQDAEREDERADRRDQVVGRHAEALGVVVDAPRHPRQAGRVLDQEGHVEADEHQPERQLPERLREHPAAHLREPVVEPGEDPEHRAAEQHVVEVGDHEVGVVQLPVDGEDRQDHARDAADHEQAGHRGGEVERRLE